MTAARLEVEGLSAGYGPTLILDAVSLAVPAGGRLAVLGRNGMGKTTLLATLAGQTRLHGGSVRLDGVELTALDGSTRARAGLGYVPQGRAIFKSLSVAENLIAGLKDRPRGAVEEAYALFPRLRERHNNLGSQLSGGEQQMLSVARTLLGQPSVLLLDEPLEGLAPVLADELMVALSSMAMSVVLVEQRIAAALAFADSVVVLERGRVAWQGTPAALRADIGAVERLLGVGAVAKGGAES